jgi:hypothetical protein
MERHSGRKVHSIRFVARMFGSIFVQAAGSVESSRFFPAGSAVLGDAIIAGIVVGTIAAVAVLVFCIWWCIIRTACSIACCGAV